MSEEIDVLLKIGSKFYEGKVHPQAPEQHPSTSNVKGPIFPEPYAEMLTITNEGAHWIVRPREFLRRDDFSEIARIVRQYQGEYVSAGKSSFFRIPK